MFNCAEIVHQIGVCSYKRAAHPRPIQSRKDTWTAIVQHGKPKTQYNDKTDPVTQQSQNDQQQEIVQPILHPSQTQDTEKSLHYEVTETLTKRKQNKQKCRSKNIRHKSNRWRW
jgi:hypothetical protein